MSNSYLSVGFRNTVLALLPSYIAKRVQTLTFSSTLAVNWSSTDVWNLTLTGNTTITNSGAVDGQQLLLYVTQDGTGSRTITFTGETVFNGSLTALGLSTAAGTTDLVQLIYRASSGKYNPVSVIKGVA